MPYLIMLPESVAGVYERRDECLELLDGLKGERRSMEVASWEEGRHLGWEGVRLEPGGSYAFTDGNALGGIGLVAQTDAP
jgi:hypothetical protein